MFQPALYGFRPKRSLMRATMAARECREGGGRGGGCGGATGGGKGAGLRGDGGSDSNGDGHSGGGGKSGSGGGDRGGDSGSGGTIGGGAKGVVTKKSELPSRSVREPISMPPTRKVATAAADQCRKPVEW